MTQDSSHDKPAATPAASGEAKLWGGRFSEPTDAFVERFTASVDFDRRLYREDIQGSQAHARMLAKVGVLTEAEAGEILAGLDAIRDEIAPASSTGRSGARTCT